MSEEHSGAANERCTGARGVARPLAEGRDGAERKLVEEALRAKPEELERYFTLAPGLFCIADTRGHFRRLSREWDVVLGYSAAELEDTRLLDHVHPHDLSVTEKTLARLANQEEVLGFVNRVRAKDGSYRWIEWRSVPMGRLIYSHAHDITDHRRVEEALRGNEARYRALVQSQVDLVSRYLPDTTLTFVNDAYCKFYGKTREELIGKSFLSMVAPQFHDAIRRETAESCRIARTTIGEYLNLTQEGQRCWLQWIIRGITDERERVIELQAVGRDITPLKEAEDALRESQRFLEAVLEHSPNPMWVSDDRGTLIRLNQACRDLLGIKERDLIGKYNILEDVQIERQGLKDLVRRVLELGEQVHFTLRHRRSSEENLKDPEPSILEVTISPVRGAEGQVAHAVVQYQDVTERARAEAALERVNRQLRMLSACNQAMIRATDERELLFSVCDLIVQMGGYGMAWIGYAQEGGLLPIKAVAQAGHEAGYLQEVYPPWDESSDRARPPIAAALRTGKPCPVQDLGLDPRVGRWAAEAVRRGYHAVCGVPLMAGSRTIGALEVYATQAGAFDPGEVAHLCELASDLAFGITTLRTRAERVQAEETLRTSEERFRRLLLHSNDVFVITDREGVLTHVSGAIEKTLGYKPQELIGTRGFDAIHPDDAVFLHPQFAEFTRQPGAGLRSEYRARHRNGNWVWLEVVGTNLIDDAVVRGVVLNIRDIMERKGAEEERDALQNQLQQAMKMEAVGRLAGGVAHDFNNLLTAILGNMDLVRMELEPAHPLLLHVDEANKAAESAASLTRQLLAFSRRQVIEPRVVSLKDLIANLRMMLGRIIGEHISLEFRAPPDLGSVRVDPGQFEQVLVNLAVNARDAMPNGGRLLIDAANVELDGEYRARHPYVKEGPFVMLSVSDTGHGMSQEVKRHLFEPFFTTKPKGRGTGLGLATIFGIVKQAGGTVEVYSEVGQGTSFKIYLPRIAGHAAVVAGEKPFPVLPGGDETILLVEDDAGVRELARSFLERLGYRVLVATNGQQALEIAVTQGASIHLLLTDVVMPGMNGRELAERLLGSHAKMKVLFSSGYTENIMDDGVGNGPLDFIGKPYSVQALAKKIRAVLGRETPQGTQ